MKKRKVLVLGIGQSNFLNQLYGDMAIKSDEFEFSIDNYFELSGRDIDNKSFPYKNFFNFKDVEIPRWTLKRYLLSFSKSRLFWKIFFFERSQGSSFKHTKQMLYDFAKAKYCLENHVLKLNIDLYHFHFCTPKNLMYLYFLPDLANVICSFWGSDLLRQTGIGNVFYVRQALMKAKAITVQTPEMAEILLCKYGRDLSDKIKILRFTLNTRIFECIDDNISNFDNINSFKSKYNIPLDKTIMAVGHNGHKDNHHIHILEAIKKLPKHLLDSIVVILHIAYGGNASYFKELDTFSKQANELNIITIKDFFEPKEVAIFRIITDIHIQMPLSDALSGAMTEVLFAKNLVIAGAWLPYGLLRRKDVYFKEADSYQDLKTVLECSLLNLKEEKAKCTSNPKAIRAFLFPDTTTRNWIKLYESMV